MPVSVGKSVVRHSCYARMDLSVPGNQEMFEMTWESAHSIVQRQDLPYGVTTAHAGITNKAMPKFLFGQNELALQHMHKEIRRAVAETRLFGVGPPAPAAQPRQSFAPTIWRAAR